MHSPSLPCCDDKKWLNLPSPRCDSCNERGVFVHFSLCSCVGEAVMAKSKFDIVEFEVGGGFVGEGVMSVEAFNE